jgi:sarcosine oxidase
MRRRDFIKIASARASAVAAACASGAGPSVLQGQPAGASEIVVVGAGAFGGWTAYHLQRLGHQVTLVDLYGPGNSRSTSGDETRGIRTGYGDHELWTRWAMEAIARWKAWDAEWGTRMFTTTGDLCMRPGWDPYLVSTAAMWENVGVRFERISPEEVRYRFPQINVDPFEAGVYEPDAGVCRSRHACLVVAEQFQRLGGRIVIGRAEPGGRASGRLADVLLHPGGRLVADAFVFALGPWFPKVMPGLLDMRIPLGHVYYFGTPPGDRRFSTPNCPSYNFPGVTGWPTLEHDSRGFRLRTGGRTGADPDTSERAIPPEHHAGARQILADRFPGMADSPLLETRSCHYEFLSTDNFVVDRHPELDNVWIVGGGSAEGFKFGPMIGPYAADRVTGRDEDPVLADAFRLPRLQ